jgi:hypothetical protein
VTPSQRDRALTRLEAAKRGGLPAGRLAALLGELAKLDFDDARALVRFHEALLFLRAHPPSVTLLARVERLLSSFAKRVKRLHAVGADLAPLDDLDVSGVAGTAITMAYSYDFARWLVSRHPRSVRVDWDGYEWADRLAAAWPRFIPLLEEEALADANVPYREWLSAARGKREGELGWLLARFEALEMPATRRAELYDALGLFLEWNLGDSAASRTRLRVPSRSVFFHEGPLLARRDVDLGRELARPALPVRRVPAREAERVLDAARAAMGTRYRELYGFTHGDPRAAVAASPGRGVQIFLVGLPPERRLPLRAGFALFVVRNGVPLGYGDVFALFERAEVSFNVFPTFREGESAWTYAQVLRFYGRILGARSFSVDPYQIGLGNDEALDSGAFWFYRKLGFRCARPELEELSRREERRVARDPAHRSSRRVLERLSNGPLLYERGLPLGAWDRFHVRNLGLAAARRARGLSDATSARRRAAARVASAGELAPNRWPAAARAAFASLALVFDSIPALGSWTREERALLGAIARAKAARTELGYLRLLRRHARLRAAILRLGSA